MKYGSFDPANFRYQDSTYDLKRTWISRLLTQFIYEDLIIISVDESNFRSDKLAKRQWYFSPKVGQKKRLKSKRKRALVNPLYENDDVLKYGERLLTGNLGSIRRDRVEGKEQIDGRNIHMG